jgi:spore maturation protein CgeB
MSPSVRPMNLENKGMRFLIVDSYYPQFLKTFYRAREGMAEKSYREQWGILMNQCFGTADFYSLNLNRLGHEATEVVFNCEPLQRQWAKEQGFHFNDTTWQLDTWRGWIPRVKRGKSSRWLYSILGAQVKEYRPDILYVQCMEYMPSSFLREMRSHVRVIIGQIASAIPSGADFSQYDMILSSLPHYVSRFRQQGMNSYPLRLGFENSLLSKVRLLSPIYEVVHVGGYGPVHRERNELLERLIKSGLPLRCWGYGHECLPANSPILDRYEGEAWGLDMYNIRYSSRIVVSRHISSVASVYANIMTMYEATGIGTLLVIDEREDLKNLFEPFQEIITYRTAQECAGLIKFYLEHEKERQEVASAGQRRTMKEHNYHVRMEELLEILGKGLGGRI